jgi:biotin synthase
LNYRVVVEDIVGIVKAIRDLSKVPISVSCQPLGHQDMLKLSRVGVNRVSIALDAVTKNLFDSIKGSPIGGTYDWDEHMNALEQALVIFGQGNVTTHLIAGLGENEEEIIRTIQKCVDMGIYPALFAFTPIEGTKMADRSQPPLIYYRRLQLAHFLITHDTSQYDRMVFEDGCLKSFGISRNALRELIKTGEPFITSGCPGCNRPYYNERPSGPIYNYPKNPDSRQIRDILESFSKS